MATSNVYPSHLICQCCFKPFNDPRMLPCLHSFCSNCLNRAVKEGTHSSIQCPTCQRIIPVPARRASAFPQNLHLGFEVEIAGYTSKLVRDCGVPCTFCASGCTENAVAFCYSCSQFMCTFGLVSHKRASHLYNHSTVELDKKSAELLPTVIKRRDQYCHKAKHSKLELDYYCNTCSCLICRDCTVVFHKDHSVTELSTVAKSYKGEMRRTLQSAGQTVSTLNNAIIANEKVLHQLEASKKEVEHAVEIFYNKMIKHLEDIKGALLSELDNISSSRAVTLHLQRVQLEAMQHEINRYSDLSSQILHTYTEHEVVTLGQIVPTELKSVINEVQNTLLTPTLHSFLKFFIEKDPEPLIKELYKCNKILELSPSPEKSVCTYQPTGKVNSPYIIELKTMSSTGEAYPCGGLEVKLEMQSRSPDDTATFGKTADHGNGTYTICVTPKASGSYYMHLTMGTKHVQNSPFSIAIVHDYTEMNQPSEIIRVNSNPFCIGVHENGDIYVSGSDHRLHVFDHSGQPKDSIESSALSNIHFNGPGIYIKQNVMYVTDYYNNRIQKLTVDGTFVHEFGETGIGQGQLSGPWNVVIDSNDRVLVSDSDNNRVQVFSQEGDWLMAIDGNGEENCSFSDPRGLALDPQGNVHITASASNTVKVFTPEGMHVRTYGDVNCPVGIAVDKNGYSFVSERCGNCLSIFDPKGEKVHTVGNLNNPCGVALSADDDRVYVSNCGGKYVYMYVLP